MALEVAEKGVRVNSIHPSLVDTEMMTSLEDGSGQDEFLEQIPHDRHADAKELASLVLLLASDGSDSSPDLNIELMRYGRPTVNIQIKKRLSSNFS